MARKKLKGKGPSFRSFNVVYVDGTISSNRRVDSNLLDVSFGDDIDDLVKVAILEQDKQIAERSGQSRGEIKSIKPA